MKKNVLIGGVIYGMHNVGDEAILESIIQTFHTHTNLSVMSCDSEWITQKYPDVSKLPIPVIYGKPKLGLHALPRRKLFQSIKNTIAPNLSYFAEQDYMLCGGGTILSDSPWHSLYMIKLAAKAGVPTIIWGAGMAEVSDCKTCNYIKKICNLPSVLRIFTRDEFVKQRLIACGVEAEKIEVCYDPAYMLNADENPDFSFLDERGLAMYADERPNICISLSGEPDVINTSHIQQVKAYVETVSQFANVFLVPTGFSNACRDKVLLSDLLINQQVVLIREELQPTQLIAFLQKMDLVVASRLHCSIFGAVAGVPSINIIRNEKNRDFATMFQLPALSMQDVRSEKLLELTKNLLAQKENVQKRISERVQYMRDAYIMATEKVVNIFNQ